ncbi:MAG: NUDIX domain-containing protein [Planctomycetes bacterium]|nr:NUDIX domain-containing protein [Planctomycetota bacterium]
MSRKKKKRSGPKPRVRPLAICVFRDGDRILAAEGYDREKRETFYRPLGGRIEFGERGAECVAREIREEIGAEVRELSYLGTIENLYDFEGEAGHEIVLVYDAAFQDRSFYSRERIRGVDGHVRIRGVWLALSQVRRLGVALYPQGLLELLEGRQR